MKLLFKIVFMLFALTQMAQAGRFFSEHQGRFVSRDPLGYVDGMSLYNGYFAEHQALDPSGTVWEDQGGDVWKASENGDTLAKLAILVSGDSKDWTCLWPIVWKKDYMWPIASCNDTVDVSNLTKKKGPVYKVMVDNDPSAWHSVFGAIPFLRADKVAAKIKALSGEGATPLSYLLVAGHSGSSGMRGDVGGVAYRFKAKDLLELSEAPTFERAKQKKGPCRCWFTKNATTVFPGCLSYGAMAEPMAKNILRKGATAWGTLFITKWANGLMSWTQADDEGNQHLGDDGPWGVWNHPEAWNSAQGQQ